MDSLVAQTVKRLPTMRETWVQSMGQEDPLEKKMATHSSILAWKIPWTEECSRLQSMGSQRVRHDWATSLSLLALCMDYNRLWEIIKEMEYQTTFSVSQETCIQIKKQVRTGTPDWLNIVKGVWEGCTLSPCSFSPNLYAEYIRHNSGLNESQPGIKISRTIKTSDMQMIPL